jgi:hypothetical protein
MFLYNLPFSEHDEKWRSSSNGNFMGIIKPIAEFDPFLYEDLEKCQNKKKS